MKTKYAAVFSFSCFGIELFHSFSVFFVVDQTRESIQDSRMKESFLLKGFLSKRCDERSPGNKGVVSAHEKSKLSE